MAPGQPRQCQCGKDASTALTSQTVTAVKTTAKYNWGLIAGLVIAGYVVFKIA